MRGRSYVDDYLAQLHAKGERLYYTDPPFPKMTNGTPRLDKLVNAAGHISALGAIAYSEMTRPGEVEVAWAQPKVREDTFTSSIPSQPKTNYSEWNQLVHTLEYDEKWLAEIRASLDEPEPDMGWQTNIFSYRRTFVEQRKAAQSLAAATLLALHQNDKAAALNNLQPLIRMAMLERDETTLVSQMIRVGICGLGLSITWQALQADGWTDEQLAQMQTPWEKVQIIDTMEKGMTGERVHVESHLRWLRESATNGMDWSLSGRNPAFGDRVLTTLWRATVANQDEFFFVSTMQRFIEHGRMALKGTSLYEVAKLFDEDNEFVGSKLRRAEARYKYPFSSIAIPNYSRAYQTCIHTIVQQRLTLAAIALMRYKLRYGKWPESLDKLVPEFLVEAPRDPMDWKPLRYRVNADSTFTMYSIGDNGKDDGGDPHTAADSADRNLFTGLDIVWPRPAK